jgi:hypothetical protein
VTVTFNVARFVVLTVVLLSIPVFGAVMPYGLIKREFLKNRGAGVFRVKQHYQ